MKSWPDQIFGSGAGEGDVLAGISEHIAQPSSGGSARLAEEPDRRTWLYIEGDALARAPVDLQEQLVLAARHWQLDALTTLDLADRIAVDHDDVASEPVAHSAGLAGDHDGCVVSVAVHAVTLEVFAPPRLVIGWDDDGGTTAVLVSLD